jgi:hypothetical protein
LVTVKVLFGREPPIGSSLRTSTDKMGRDKTTPQTKLFGSQSKVEIGILCVLFILVLIINSMR